MQSFVAAMLEQRVITNQDVRYTEATDGNIIAHMEAVGDRGSHVTYFRVGCRPADFSLAARGSTRGSN